MRQLRAELGTDHGIVKRVAGQLGYGVESVRAWVRQADVAVGAAVLEALFYGDDIEAGHADLTVVWLSDLPNVNEQTLAKIKLASDLIRDDQLVQVDTGFVGDELLPNRVYFLNTQKLRESSHLVSESEERAFTIWEVLDRTMRRDPSRFVLIIDEAHRGMEHKQSKSTAKAASIVQRFILGSGEMARSPIIVGISATPRQFDNLIAGTSRTTRKAEADVADRSHSGRLGTCRAEACESAAPAHRRTGIWGSAPHRANAAPRTIPLRQRR